MKLTLSLNGRLHAFEVAALLSQRDALGRLMTTHPKFLVAKHGIPRENLVTNPALEVMRRLWSRAPAALTAKWNAQYFFNHSFDLWAASRLRREADVFVGWSGLSLHALRRAKELGMVATVDRGSSHMLTQQRLLVEEYDRFGLRFTETHPKIIEQEVQEYEEADHIHVASRFAFDSFREHGVSEKKLVPLPYGFTPGAFKTTAKKDAGFRIVYCGNITLQKGFYYLLEAFSQLRLSGAELWVFGAKGAEIDASKIKLDRPNVKYFGKQPWSVLADHFSRATVFCLPSVQDGFAVVVLQAMACGLPVIGTVNSGTPDAVRDGEDGFVVPIRSVEALKEKLQWCHDNRDRCDEMGRSAQKRAYERFQWTHYADRLLSFYDSLLSGRKSASAGPSR
jgi:glycosyltransferase involved in cell wall biosynthesis